MDLVEFLRARINEDEAEAKETADADAEFWADIVGDGTYFAFNNPARVLREVEAKRAILDEHAAGANQEGCCVCHAGGWDWEPEKWPCPTVRAMVAVYSDHPDYDPAWR